MKLGVAGLCLAGQGWDLPQIMEYSAWLGVDTLLLGRKQVMSQDEDYLLSLRHRADELGLCLEVEAGCIDRYSTVFRHDLGPAEDQLGTMIQVARILGSSSIQCFLGSQVDRLGAVPFDQHVEECVRVIRAVIPQIQEMGIRPALENHCDFLARELKALVEEVGPDYLGVCLDTGNPTFMGEDPAITTELLAPYTLMTHLRDSRVWAVPEGAMVQWVPMGQGNTNLPGITAQLMQQAPNVTLNLEIITGSEPRLLQYVGPECELWRSFPDMLARDFVRFIALAQGGKPEPLDQLTAPRGPRGPLQGALAEQLKAQLLRHHRESVVYCREMLGLGERDR